MTIENAVFVFAAGIILVVLIIWYTHRRASRRLGKLQNDLDALRQAFDLMSSRLLMTVLNRKPGETAASSESTITENVTPLKRDQ
jgi:hypothetical protein